MGLRASTRRFAAPTFLVALACSVAPVLTRASVIINGVSGITARTTNFEDDKTATADLTTIPQFKDVTTPPFQNGDDYATTTAALAQTSFVFTFDHLAEFSRTTSSAVVRFTVDVDTQYAFSGSYAAVGRFYSQELFAQLKEGAEASLYLSNQDGFYQTDHTLVLGQQTGNNSNELSGSATGLLLAGHSYTFTTSAALEPVSDPTGVGTVTLSFAAVGGPPVGGQVPLPAAVWVGAIAGAGVIARARGRRVKSAI
jgi:hypothetical protein